MAIGNAKGIVTSKEIRQSAAKHLIKDEGSTTIRNGVENELTNYFRSATIFQINLLSILFLSKNVLSLRY